MQIESTHYHNDCNYSVLIEDYRRFFGRFVLLQLGLACGELKKNRNMILSGISPTSKLRYS